MTFSDDILMAYADGELDLRTRAQVEDAMATDPQSARRVAAHQALRNTLRAGFDKVLDEPIPERLIAAARPTAGAPSENGVVVPLRPRRARTLAFAHWAWPQWGAMAASFVSGALDKALSGQLASEQPSQAPVQIGVSFRSKDGSYCRTFQVREHANLAGLACRDQDKWRLEALAQSEAAPAGAHSD